jgi:hypothetical protein
MFSEGVAIPANVAARFRSVIDTANRANVSIYAMDAGGYVPNSIGGPGTASTQRQPRSAGTDLGRRRRADDRSARAQRGPLRRDRTAAWASVSDETGGILIGN